VKPRIAKLPQFRNLRNRCDQCVEFRGEPGKDGACALHLCPKMAGAYACDRGRAR
jgi:hypothetical protein